MAARLSWRRRRVDKFARGAEPDCLANSRAELCQGAFDAGDVWNRFRGRNCYYEARQTLLNTSQQTCAFCAGFAFAFSPATIEHFEPKAGEHAKPDAVLDWSNLFPACMRCQQAKGDGYSSALLKPDDAGYSPVRHFIANYDGSIDAVPGEDGERANVTIDMYDLNRVELKILRKRALEIARKKPSSEPFEGFRFFAELLS